MWSWVPKNYTALMLHEIDFFLEISARCLNPLNSYRVRNKCYGESDGYGWTNKNHRLVIALAAWVIIHL